MATSLATVRTRLRNLLDDAGATVWTDAELDLHTNTALRDLSQAVPRQQKSTNSTTSGSRNISLATYTDRLGIQAVEYPIGNDPETFVRFRVWGDTLTLLDGPVPDGSNANIYWHALHLINGTSTLPTEHDDALLLGAAWLACEQQANDTTNVLNTGGPATPGDWSSRAEAFRDDYVARRNPRRGVRQHRTYEPSERAASQDTDPGP